MNQTSHGLTGRPSRVEYGVELDDRGSVDLTDDLAAARAQVREHGGQVVRIETWPEHEHPVSTDRDAWIEHVRRELDRADEQVVDVVLHVLRDGAPAGAMTVGDVLVNYHQAQENYSEALAG